MTDVKSFLATVDTVFGTNVPLADNDTTDNISVYNENTKFSDKDARTYGAITYLFEDTIQVDDYAYPFDKNNFTFPKKGETVIILKMFGRNEQTFYLPYTNTSYPNYRRDYITYERSSKKDLESVGKDSSGSDLKNIANSGGKTETNKTNKEDNVSVNEKIKFLQPKEGDSIISGRVGNTIRFSEFFLTEDDKTSSPGIYIRNKQNPELDSKLIGELVTEDINKDGSSIYMTSGKIKVPFKETIKKSKVAFKDFPSSDKLKGDQLFVNSDRVILSSKSSEFIIFGKGNTGIITDGRFTIDSDKDTYIQSNQIITIESDKNIILNTKGTGNIYLGEEGIEGSAGAPVQPMVLGGELIKILEDLISEITKSIYAGSCGPSTLSSANVRALNSIKSNLREILSGRNFLTKR